MSAGALVVGLGQAAAGDDGAGLAVIERLRGATALPSAHLDTLCDASALVPLLATHAHVVIVDAALGTPGAVAVHDAGALGRAPSSSLSSHGLSIGQAIELARALYPDAARTRIEVVVIGIERPQTYGIGLSPAVQLGVTRAANRIRALLDEPPPP